MFEIDQYDARLNKEQPTRADLPYSATDDVDAISLMVWGEHCTECAAPACYKSCDLFEARPDTRCRRFRFGIYKNKRFKSFRGYGAEVAFKKWGVLAAMGNTAVASRSATIWLERFVALAAPILNTVGPVVSRITKDERWTYPAFGFSRRLASWLHQRNKGRSKPDAFLLEIYNPGLETVRMQLGMDYTPDARHKFTDIVQIRPRFRTTVAFPPGYSRHEFDRRLFQSFADTSLPFNIALVPEADTSAQLIFLSADFIRYRNQKATAVERPDIKCVVWDLDNTMWDGILVEDDEIHLKASVRKTLEVLDQRGILFSIASKNNHEAAWRRLQEFGIADYFLVPQINWASKSESVKNIAKKLNIGLDTLAFIDDNPFELNEVGTAIPEVACIHVQDVEGLLKDKRFQGSKTADAQNRRRYYQEAIDREEKHTEFGGDYLKFLEYCEIRLEIRNYCEEDFDRVSEFAQRTNQLNFSGRKYDRDQLRPILNNPEIEKYVLYCSDKFGAYGLIGFGMARQTGQDLEIQDLMLSCRVQGKLVEHAFFTHLEWHHNPKDAVRLRVNFTETKRNQPARQVLESTAFQKLEEGGFAREIRTGNAHTSGIVQVRCDACCNIEAAALKG